MTPVNLRPATLADAAAILAIYRPYIEETDISFEVTVPSLAEFEGRMRLIMAKFPYLVATVEDRVVGYAYAAEHRERAAYGWNADLTVYLDRAFTGRGLGRTLYQALLKILKLQKIQNVYGIVTHPNPASEALHQRLEFREVGIFRQTGHKFGRWLDVVWYEKFLGDHEERPQPPLAFSELDKRTVESMLQRFIPERGVDLKK